MSCDTSTSARVRVRVETIDKTNDRDHHDRRNRSDHSKVRSEVGYGKKIAKEMCELLPSSLGRRSDRHPRGDGIVLHVSIDSC